jgi:hypothetical protein
MGPKSQLLSAATLLSLAAASAFAITSNPVIVTVQAPKDAPAPAITAHDVVARVDNKPAAIAGWHALAEDPAGLELWIMIDEGTDTRIGVQFEDIRNFIRQQPPAAKVAIGYVRNGSVYAVQKPTTDHEAAAKAIRLPEAIPGISASPYIAIADFLHKLPRAPQPREIVLISSGIDPYYGPGPENPYLLNAMHDAQKAGVPVFSIYFASAGSLGRRYWNVNWGQNDLSELSEGTGGRLYWEGDHNPVSLKPFFDDVNHRIAEQYVMRLDVPGTHSGFDSLRLHSESPQITLVGPTQIYTR